MFGTLRDTRTPSAVLEAAGATAGVCKTSTETGSVSATQPAMDAMTQPVNSIGTNFFKVILQKKPTTHKNGCEPSPFKGLPER
jgi:deoxyribose-phosphate aldolase